jgi:type II secretory pathway pseudopilin PulG
VFVPVPIFPCNTRRRRPRERPRPTELRSEGGFTVIEVLVAVVVLIVGLTALFGLLDTSLKATASTRAREGATNLAREILEDAGTIPYAQISPNSLVSQLQAMNGLANISGGATWQIERRGITYTVKVKECAIDDPKNGFGKHENAFKENPFCKDKGEEEGTADPQPENLKRITVDVTWTAIGRTPSVHQVKTLTAAGGTPGLTAGELELSVPKVGAPTAPVIITQPAENKLTFTVKSPKGTEGMSWSLDGVRQPTAPTFVSGTEWTFSWSIPLATVSDGAYRIAAQAVDATGVSGPPISMTVTLIRSTPAAPKVLNAGFNEVNQSGKKVKVAELLWQANSERNVIGYRVYNAESKLVCPTSTEELSLAVSCIDLNLAAKATESNQVYSVVAVYRVNEGELLSKNVTNGPATKVTLEKGPPAGPNVPVGPLTATKNADGSVTLKWSAPSGGSAPVLYRIYRGSEEYTSRYGVAYPAGLEFTDTSASVEHTYRVTAVNANMTESPFLGPVTK